MRRSRVVTASHPGLITTLVERASCGNTEERMIFNIPISGIVMLNQNTTHAGHPNHHATPCT